MKHISFFIFYVFLVSNIFISGKALLALAPQSLSEKLNNELDNAELTELTLNQNDLDTSEQIETNKASQSKGVFVAEALNNPFTWISLVLLLLSSLFFLLFYVAGLHYYGIFFAGIGFGIIAIIWFIKAIIMAKRDYDENLVKPPVSPENSVDFDSTTPPKNLPSGFIKDSSLQFSLLQKSFSNNEFSRFHKVGIIDLDRNLKELDNFLSSHISQHLTVFPKNLTYGDLAKSLMFLIFNPKFRKILDHTIKQAMKVGILPDNTNITMYLRSILMQLSSYHSLIESMPQENKKRQDNFKDFYESFDIDLNEKESSPELITLHMKEQEKLTNLSQFLKNFQELLKSS